MLLKLGLHLLDFLVLAASAAQGYLCSLFSILTIEFTRAEKWGNKEREGGVTEQLR